MIVSEFIQWLQTQDQGATVKIVVYYDTYKGHVQRDDDFDPNEHVEYMDMRGNQFAKGKPYAEARTLLLGVL